jgi:hypothetical protein
MKSKQEWLQLRRELLCAVGTKLSEGSVLQKDRDPHLVSGIDPGGERMTMELLIKPAL